MTKLGIFYRRYGLGSKGQSSRSWSCKTYFMRSSVAREFALYRVTLDDEMMFIFAERRLLHVKVGHIRPRTLTLEIPQATVDGSRNIDVISGGFQLSGRPHNPTPRFRPSPRRQWSLLNRFRTGQGHCNACRKKCGFTDNELCDCGETQTMCHISSTLVH